MNTACTIGGQFVREINLFFPIGWSVLGAKLNVI